MRTVMEPGPMALEQVERLQPWISHILEQSDGDGYDFAQPDQVELANPVTKPYAVVSVDTRVFNKHSVLQYVRRLVDPSGRLPTVELHGRDWWEGGMMSFVVTEVYLVSDDGKSLFAFFRVLNKPFYTMLLGRLRPGHAFTEQILALFARRLGTVDHA